MTDHIIKTIGANRLVLRCIDLDDGDGEPIKILIRQALFGGEWKDTVIGIANPIVLELVQEMAEELMELRQT